MFSNHLRIPAFDMVTLNKVKQRAIFKKRNAWRRGG